MVVVLLLLSKDLNVNDLFYFISSRILPSTVTFPYAEYMFAEGASARSLVSDRLGADIGDLVSRIGVDAEVI